VLTDGKSEDIGGARKCETVAVKAVREKPWPLWGSSLHSSVVREDVLLLKLEILIFGRLEDFANRYATQVSYLAISFCSIFSYLPESFKVQYPRAPATRIATGTNRRSTSAVPTMSMVAGTYTRAITLELVGADDMRAR